MSRAMLPVLLTLALVGCGGGEEADPALPPATELTGARAHAPAPETSGTLANVPDVREARIRLGYVNVERLAHAELPIRAEAVIRQVLGPGAALVRERRPATAVRVGGATVIYGTQPPVVTGAGSRLASALAKTPPETSAIAPSAMSAAQSCLGDTLAQTVLGPGTMGADAALGVGLAESGDAPSGLQLRLCGAPRLIRHVHRMGERLVAAFDRGPSVIGEREIGEREIVSATVAAGSLPPDRLLALLGAGRELRSLAWR